MGVGVEEEKAGGVGILTGGSSRDNGGLGRVGSEAADDYYFLLQGKTWNKFPSYFDYL